MTRAYNTATTQQNTGGAIPAFIAGKNAIINGDFNINQRAFTTTSTDNTYGFDRWRLRLSGATATYSAQTFSLGTAPVAGYEGKNFARVAVATGNDFLRFEQYIESVRTFANQTVTLSFWAKGTNPTTAGNLKAYLQQYMGTGGSPSADVLTAEQTFVLTANWTKYSLTFTLGSLAGKTLGTNNNDALVVVFGQGSNASTDSYTLDIWGVQLEAGSVATPFTTATGTIQGELAACQRYYYLHASGTTVAIGSSAFYNADYCYGTVNFPVTMRITPTLIMTSGTNYYICSRTGGYAYFDYFNLDVANKSVAHILRIQASSGTSGVAGILFTNNASSSMAFNAEL